jgi:hypothetical protein
MPIGVPRIIYCWEKNSQLNGQIFIILSSEEEWYFNAIFR